MIELIIVSVILIFLMLFALTSLTQVFFAVPYVPSKYSVVKRMVSLANIRPKEKVFDLGCGDGRLLFEAERKRKKIQAVGFEVAPLVYLFALLKKWFFSSGASFKFRNFFRVSLRDADVIFCYLLPGTMEKLSQKIRKECRKGTRIISNTFHLPGFRPVKVLKRNRRVGLPTIYLYRV